MCGAAGLDTGVFRDKRGRRTDAETATSDISKPSWFDPQRVRKITGFGIIVPSIAVRWYMTFKKT